MRKYLSVCTCASIFYLNLIPLPLPYPPLNLNLQKESTLIPKYSQFRTLLLTSIRNALNLHRHALGQLLDRYTGPCRLVGKVLFKDAIHFGEMCHIVEEDVDLVSKR
jgi:hypothetical protein